MSAALFRSGPFADMPAADVRIEHLRRVLAKPDVFPTVRAKIEGELARGGTSSTTDASGDDSPARPLVAQHPRASTAEALPPELQGSEPVEFRFACAHCGRTSIIRGVVDVR